MDGHRWRRAFSATLESAMTRVRKPLSFKKDDILRVPAAAIEKPTLGLTTRPQPEIAYSHDPT
jgi:hypothetical protein